MPVRVVQIVPTSPLRVGLFGSAAVLHKLEEAGCHDDRSPPLRDLIRRGRTPPPIARSVSLWRTAPPKDPEDTTFPILPRGTTDV
jgi:hypothetical protein